MTQTTTLMTSPREFVGRCWPAIALLAVLLLAVVAYAAWPRMTATTAATATTATNPGWSRTCVGGVSYLQFPSGATVEWTPVGKVKTCTEPTK